MLCVLSDNTYIVPKWISRIWLIYFYLIIIFITKLGLIEFNSKIFGKLYRKNLNCYISFCIIQLVKGINYRLKRVRVYPQRRIIMTYVN